MATLESSEYSNIRGKILAPDLEMPVFNAISTRPDYADPFLLYSNPELLKRVASAYADRLGEFHGDIISIGEPGFPLAINIAMEYSERGIIDVYALLFSFENGGEIRPPCQPYKGDKIIVVRHVLEDGSYVRNFVKNILAKPDTEPCTLLSILDNDAEPNREALREVLDTGIDAWSLCRASSREPL